MSTTFIAFTEKIINKFSSGHNLYNVGYGRRYALNEVSEILARLLNKKIYIWYDKKMRPDNVKDMVDDISKVSKAFN
jgi:UDP-glucose 4-epimerase